MCIWCFTSAKKTLHWKKPTWQEYPWPDLTRDFGSENAVDGLYSDRGTGGQCTFNNDGHYTAEWRVDLGGVVSISYINIYYRTDNQSMVYTYFLNKMRKLHIYKWMIFFLLSVTIINVNMSIQNQQFNGVSWLIVFLFAINLK